jgi:hypothetical protein
MVAGKLELLTTARVKILVVGLFFQVRLDGMFKVNG